MPVRSGGVDPRWDCAAPAQALMDENGFRPIADPGGGSWIADAAEKGGAKASAEWIALAQT